MLKKDLADALGISAAMVSKLSKRGMPTDSVERARRWRKRHLEQGRVKGMRAGTQALPPPPPGPCPEKDVVEQLMQAAGEVLDSGGDIAHLVPGLRLAMAAVPENRRAEVRFSGPVMDVLTAEVSAVLAQYQDADSPASDRPQISHTSGHVCDESEWDEGRFWYQVAAGEIRTAAHAGDV